MATSDLRMVNGAMQEYRMRVRMGLQCPECMGPHVSERNRQYEGPFKWLCESCGCKWDLNYFPAEP